MGKILNYKQNWWRNSHKIESVTCSTIVSVSFSMSMRSPKSETAVQILLYSSTNIFPLFADLARFAFVEIIAESINTKMKFCTNVGSCLVYCGISRGAGRFALGRKLKRARALQVLDKGLLIRGCI